MRKINRFKLMSGMLAGLLVLTIGVPVLAKPPFAKGHDKQGGPPGRVQHWDDRNDQRGNRRYDDDFTFSQTQRGILADLLMNRYGDRHGHLMDPSLLHSIQQQSALPPGIQKNLMRGKPLPPGIAKKTIWLPDGVNYRLGLNGYPDYRVGVAGRDVFIYNTATGLVLDVLSNLLNN